MTSVSQATPSIDYNSIEHHAASNFNYAVRATLSMGRKTSAANFFYSFDHLSSTRDICDQSGALQLQASYTPFGEAIIHSGTVALENGYGAYFHLDRSKLDLSQTRVYSSAKGRWLTRDYLEESFGPNLFAYVDNNPTNLTDLSGMGPGITTTSSLGRFTEFSVRGGSEGGRFYKPFDPPPLVPDPWPVPEPGTDGNPNFPKCKTKQCCQASANKCMKMCDYWYDVEVGNIPNQGYHGSCLRCCLARLSECIRKEKHCFKDCSAQGPHKPLAPNEACGSKDPDDGC